MPPLKINDLKNIFEAEISSDYDEKNAGDAAEPSLGYGQPVEKFCGQPAAVSDDQRK